MKVLALGGAGAMGVCAARMAARIPGVSELVIADRDYTAAEHVALGLSDAPVPVRARRVDVTESAGLHRALESADVVLNTVGPYYSFGLTVLQAAIATNTHYLDICDDWEPTLPMLDLDESARRAGVTAIVGMGASPGITNILAVLAARRLDNIDDVYTAWPVDPDDEDPRVDADQPMGAAAVHWMQQISGTVAVVRSGEITHEAPLRPVALRLPGDRTGTAYTVGHPEPLTLHRTLRIERHSANLMVISPRVVSFLDVLRTDIDRGALSNEHAAEHLARPTLWQSIRAALRIPRFTSPNTLPHFFATATGSRNGVPSTVVAQLKDDDTKVDAFLSDMARATGIPLALGLAQVVDGTVDHTGVHPPEAVVDPDRFFADLSQDLGLDGASELVLVEETASNARATRPA